jgi:hypothetical protein
MQVLGRLAAEAGFEAMAAISVCNVTDKLLIAGRNEEAAETAVRLMPSRDRLPRAHSIVQNNLTLALIRLGRAGQAYAPARESYASMPGIAHFLVDTFALAAAREGRFEDAAVLHGCGNRARQERDEQPDRSEEAAISQTQALLQQGLAAAECDEFCRLGAAMSPDEALRIKVFGPASATGAAAAGPRGPSSSPGFV